MTDSKRSSQLSTLLDILEEKLLKVMPERERQELHKYDEALKAVGSGHDAHVALQCAKWAIETSSKEGDGSWGHLVSSIKEVFASANEVQWAARVAEITLNSKLSTSLEVAGVDEAVKVAVALADE
ncbi:MAG: hypothetical protein HKL80_11565, partial [Acidimicrobiales bacterium]|nr:hypothetical protein [Acidimicrobiales bacterium]